ncbi:L,D-transpeptidase [Bartonella sp. LJL80]
MVPLESNGGTVYVEPQASKRTVLRKSPSSPQARSLDSQAVANYSARIDNGVPVKAVDISRFNPDYLRQEVAFNMPYKPGTIVVDPNNFFCYFVLPQGRAVRYGVGVAKTSATDFQGEATIGRKAVWPSWRPTDNMIRKQPQRYGHLTGGMKGGPTNPLGARALYLYRGGQDTLFRLHGTTEPWSIGKRVSSGCIRFLNQDIIDLYSRVSVGARAVVLPHKMGLG